MSFSFTDFREIFFKIFIYFLPESYLENPKEKADPSFEWRALRLLARQSPHFFTLFNSPSYKVSDYLDSVRKKIQKDRTEIKVIHS